MSVVDPSPVTTDPIPPADAAPVDPAAPVAAPAEATATAPRGLSAIIADIEAAIEKIKGYATRRSLLDAAEAEAKTVMASLKTEYEAEKAKLEAFF